MPQTTYDFFCSWPSRKDLLLGYLGKYFLELLMTAKYVR